MTDEEYSVWLMAPNALPVILAARRDKRPIRETIVPFFESMRARAIPRTGRRYSRWVIGSDGTNRADHRFRTPFGIVRDDSEPSRLRARHRVRLSSGQWASCL